MRRAGAAALLLAGLGTALCGCSLAWLIAEVGDIRAELDADMSAFRVPNSIADLPVPTSNLGLLEAESEDLWGTLVGLRRAKRQTPQFFYRPPVPPHHRSAALKESQGSGPIQVWPPFATHADEVTHACLLSLSPLLSSPLAKLSLPEHALSPYIRMNSQC